MRQRGSLCEGLGRRHVLLQTLSDALLKPIDTHAQTNARAHARTHAHTHTHTTHRAQWIWGRNLGQRIIGGRLPSPPQKRAAKHRQPPI